MLKVSSTLWLLLCVQLAANTCCAESPLAFPWNCGGASAKSPGVVPAPYRVLTPGSDSAAAQSPVQQLPHKASYAYGWFGSNSHPQLSRHLGFHQNYTQWTLTP